MTDEDQIAAFRATEEPPEYASICNQCGRGDGVVLGKVQQVDIAWPGGQHIRIWLHRACEKQAIERIEGQRHGR